NRRGRPSSSERRPEGTPQWRPWAVHLGSRGETRGQPFARMGTWPMRGIVAVGLLLLGVGVVRAQDMPLTQVLVEGETWKPAGKDLDHLWGLAADRAGNVFVTDPTQSGVIRVGT